MSDKFIGLSFIGLVYAVFVAGAFYLLPFFSACVLIVNGSLTFLCFLARNITLSIGDWLILPKPAKAFLFGGLASFVIAPILGAIAFALFGYPASGSAWLLFLLVGYFFSAFGGVIFRHCKEEYDEYILRCELIESYQKQAKSAETRPLPAKKNLTFAFWDDEEELR